MQRDVPNVQRRGCRSPTAVWIEKRAACGGGFTYRIRWIDPVTGKARSASAGRDRAAARLMRTSMAAELREGLTGKLPDRTLTDLVAQVPIFMAGKSPHTTRKTADSLRKLKQVCGDRWLIHVGRDMMMDFRARRLNDGVALATVNKDMRQVRSALSYAVDAEWLKFNPLLRWKKAMVREPEKVVRVVESDEFAKLLAATRNPTFRVLIAVAYYQGLRRTELANLRWTAVDLDKGGLHVVNNPEAGEYTKSRKNRTLPLHPIVRRELAALRAGTPSILDGGRIVPKFPHVFTWEDGTPFRADWITVEFARVVKSAGIEATIHDLRRSFSTLAQRAGVDRLTVKDLGGWSSVSVVERHYTGEIKPAYERAMQLLAASQAEQEAVG